MARKKEKTLEEKLQEALVPENQWPYILPENWCWTRLDFIANYKKGPFGSSLTKAMFVPKGKNTYKVYEQGNAINKSTQYGSYYITKEKYDSMDGFSVEPNDIIVSCAGTIGEIFRLPQNIEKGIINQALMRVRLNSSVVYQIFEYYFSKILIQNITDESNGTAIKNIPPFKVLKQMPFPLPPLPEQKRIVNRIESLFAKLDEAKEKIQQVLDGAEMRKASILHKAFTGELTKTWRKENGISEDSWVEYTLQSVCTMKITDGTHKTPTYSDKENGVVFLSAKDITSGEINWENTKYITSELHKELYSRLAPQINDILLAKNGTTGVAALVKEDKVFDIYVTLALLRPNVEIVIPEYLLNIINSPLCKVQFNENLTGIGVPNLHLRDIKDVKIKVPSISEQEIISDKVEMLLANEGMVTKNCLKQIEVIDTMKKSIIAKAFRGELGTNNPTEDSALNLLKEVLQDKS